MEDNIKVNKYIIHFLEKEKNKAEVKIDFSDKVSKSDDFSNVLVKSLHKSISESPSLKNTKFKINNSNEFSNSLNSYLELIEDENEDAFYELSKSITALKEKIETKPFATGGYYLFVDYFISNNRFIAVVLLRKRDGINIIKKEGVFTLDNTENINIDKIAMALRINFAIYLNSDSEEEKNNYLALITTQQDGEVSEYFKDWVNAGDMIKNSVNTKNFIRLLKLVDLPKNEIGEEKFKGVEELKRAVYEYVKDKKSKTINLSDVSSHLWGEDKKNILSETAKNYSIDIDNEFKKETRIFKELITIKASVDGIVISVDYDKINPDEVDIKEDVIIIKNKKLATKLNNRYKEEKQNGR
ncbi:nucleoid-associated protein [Flavobacterium columnare]|uniref:nucleoid-associated protein n=1 Tax=Flavobacterium columnare TaxID=996 RepID=UPI000D1A994B|nr:nucleoid-associated protein [Flavobacterium columnare]MBF6653852.1 hypothetical protein [Flavobacterium columnare]PTD15598.1 hypothetical protein C6N29_14800 [Flavobacterium columnare]QOG90990.1 nucleoid-associated protein [Flavobacterium columnare]QOG93644.1 nucleoid-associated protein [Flavobacterium columnare]QOG96311.1 nucleoid-associated protein [Flavobacterium columnare]